MPPYTSPPILPAVPQHPGAGHGVPPPPTHTHTLGCRSFTAPTHPPTNHHHHMPTHREAGGVLVIQDVDPVVPLHLGIRHVFQPGGNVAVHNQ